MTTSADDQETQRSRDADSRELLGLISRCVAASRGDITRIERSFVGIRVVGATEAESTAVPVIADR